MVFEDHEFERLMRLKGNKSWREFVLELANFKEKVEKESDFIPRSSLKGSYVAFARALSELAKLFIQEEEGYRYNDEFYLASLLPLIVAGEEVNEEDLVKLYILVTSLVFGHIKKKYKGIKDNKMYFVFEYLRMAIIRELRSDTEGFRRFMNEVCKALGELSHLD